MRTRKFPDWFSALLIAMIMLFTGTRVMAACSAPDCFATIGAIKYEVSIVRGASNEFPVLNGSGLEFKYKLHKTGTSSDPTVTYVDMLLPSSVAVGNATGDLTWPYANIKTYVNGSPSRYQLFLSGGDTATGFGAAPNDGYTLKFLGLAFISEPRISVVILNNTVGAGQKAMLLKTGTGQAIGSILEPAALPPVSQTGDGIEFLVEGGSCSMNLILSDDGKRVDKALVTPVGVTPLQACCSGDPPSNPCQVPVDSITDTWICEGESNSNCLRVTYVNSNAWLKGGDASTYYYYTPTGQRVKVTTTP